MTLAWPGCFVPGDEPEPQPQPNDKTDADAAPAGISYGSFFLPNPLDPVCHGAEIRKRQSLTWKDRIEFIEWNIFTVNLGTGAVSILLGNTVSWGGQRALGTTFFLLNIVIWLFNCTAMTARACMYPVTFKRSFSRPSEALFFPTSILAFATLYVDAITYAVPYCGFWLVKALLVVWFIYIAVSLACAAILQWTLYDQERDLITITPAECLVAFPLMLSGTLGSALAFRLDADEACYVIILSYMLQGLGFLISLQKLSAWMLRNILLGQPSDKRMYVIDLFKKRSRASQKNDHSIPIFFMAVGPPGFTAFAFLQLGQRSKTAFAEQGLFPDVQNAGEMVFMTSVVFSLIFLGQALWYMLGTLTMWLKGMSPAWWACTFPLTGFFVACARLGSYTPARIFVWIEVAGTGIVGSFWLFNLCTNIIAVRAGRIFVPPIEPIPVVPPLAADAGLAKRDQLAAQAKE